MRYIVFDTETTGLSSDKQAVEIAMLEIEADLTVLGEAETLLRPTVEISAEATAIHGISYESVKDCMTIDEWVASELGGRLEGEVTLIGHRVGFDLPLFEPIGNAVRQLDTLPLAFEYVPDSPNKKLDTLKEHLGLPGGGQSHRAMADVLTCYQLLQHLVQVSGRTLEELVTTPYVVHYMPWGKHEGELLVNVPRRYREYIIKFPDLDPNLRRSLAMVALSDTPRTPVVLGVKKPITIRKFIA
jgi:DNA polymerase III epsilon subunit-like protein